MHTVGTHSRHLVNISSGKHMGGQASPRVTQTLRELPACHPSFCLPALSDAAGASNSAPSGHPNSLPPSCQLTAQAQLPGGTSFDFLLISLSRLKSGNRGSVSDWGFGDESFNFPGALWQLEQTPEASRGDCDRRCSSRPGPAQGSAPTPSPWAAVSPRERSKDPKL